MMEAGMMKYINVLVIDFVQYYMSNIRINKNNGNNQAKKIYETFVE